MIASLSSQVSDIQILRPWWKKKLKEQEPEWTAAKLDRVTTSPRQLLHKLPAMPYARPWRPTALSEPHGFLLLLLSPFVGYEDIGAQNQVQGLKPHSNNEGQEHALETERVVSCGPKDNPAFGWRLLT